MICMAFMLPAPASAEVLDRVAAFVDNTAITMQQLDRAYAREVESHPDISREEVLSGLINRFLLIREAKELRLEAGSEDELLNEYIELKVRAFIRIEEEAIESYYDRNIDKFKDVPYTEVKDTIEKLLTEKELNSRLKQHIDKIRREAFIRTFID